MLEQDFNRLKEISKELNEIRLRNDLTELQLRAKNNSFVNEEFNEVMLLTRKEYKNEFNQYREKCNINHMRWNLTTDEFKNMDYNKYLNYK